jgi:hypothetical protein
MNESRALALALAVSPADSSDSVTGHGSLYSHYDRHRPGFHQRTTAARQGSPTRTPAQGAPILERPVPRPLVTKDSEGLTRAPEDCNKGCLDSNE